MLLLVLVSRVDRPPSLGADDTVLEATNQRENAEMFFVEHLSQFCQKRHRRTMALHAMQYEFAALQQCNRSPIATLGERQQVAERRLPWRQRVSGPYDDARSEPIRRLPLSARDHQPRCLRGMAMPIKHLTGRRRSRR